MNQTDRKHILISGVTKGLGYQMTKALLEQGHRVSGCGRSIKIIQELRLEYDLNGLFDPVDISEDSDVGKWVKKVLQERGVPDLLINNGAIMNNPNPLWKISHKEFSDMVHINILGTQNLIRHIVPAMIGKGEGIIINFSSGWGRSAAPDVGPYCTTKWAIEGLTKSLSQELPHGLAAVSLNPGIINTDMLQTCWSEAASQFMSAEEWVKSAVPFILNISTKDNGREMTVG